MYFTLHLSHIARYAPSIQSKIHLKIFGRVFSFIFKQALKEAVDSALKSNYCNFDGRASRSQYWWFYLFQIIVSSVLYCLSPILGSAATTLATLINLALLLPALGLCFRRLHDTGKSGWWILLSLTGIGIFVLLFFFAQESEMRTNEYGPVPNMVD